MLCFDLGEHGNVSYIEEDGSFYILINDEQIPINIGKDKVEAVQICLMIHLAFKSVFKKG